MGALRALPTPEDPGIVDYAVVVRDLLIARRLRASALATFLGVSKQCIYCWLAGHRPGTWQRGRLLMLLEESRQGLACMRRDVLRLEERDGIRVLEHLPTARVGVGHTAAQAMRNLLGSPLYARPPVEVPAPRPRQRALTSRVARG